MPRKCSVYGCNTNYFGADKGTVYQFPKDEAEKQAWINSLPNRDFNWTKEKGVCYKHWPADKRTRIAPGGWEIPVEPPTIFDGVPNSCVPQPATKARADNTLTTRNALPDELPEFERADVIDVHDCVSKITVSYPDCDCFESKEHLCIVSSSRSGPMHTFSVYISFTTLLADCFWGLRSVKIPFLHDRKISKYSQLEAVLHFLRTYENQDGKLEFLMRQIMLINGDSYSSDDLANSIHLRSTGTAAYEEFRRFVVLPSARHLRRISNGVSTLSNTEYFTKLFSAQNQMQSLCALLLDEIFVSPGLQYQGRQLFGESENKPGTVATRVLAAMIKCLGGGATLCLQLIPVTNMTATYLCSVISDCCKLIEKSGGKIICIVSDNNRVNQSAYAMLARNENKPWLAGSPACEKRPLFLLSDPVHLMKNVRNSWVNEPSKELVYCLSEDGEKRVAKWSTIELLYSSEVGELFRQSRLCRTAVSPDPAQKQNVKLVLNVFCDETISALRIRGENDTADFITLFLRFWKVCNVKGSNLDVRYNDKYRGVVQRDLRWQYELLKDVAFVAQFMMPLNKGDRKNKFTRDTALWLYNTCCGLIDLSEYLFENGFSFVMYGDFTTDPLEKLFGKYRQGCGGAFLVTVRSLMEKFRLDRTKFLASLDPNALWSNLREPQLHSCVSCMNVNYDFVSILPCFVEDISTDIKQVLIYVAGYVSKCTKFICEDDTYAEYEMHRLYIDSMNRGALTIPCDCVVHFMYYMYTSFLYLSSDSERKPCFQVLSEVGRQIIDYYGFLEHNVVGSFCRIACNILLNNCSNSLDDMRNGESAAKLAKFV